MNNLRLAASKTKAPARSLRALPQRRHASSKTRSDQLLEALDQRRAAAEAASQSQAAASHAAPQSEGFGLSFYLLLIALPASALIYTYRGEPNSSTNPIGWVIAKYATSQEEWRERNALHTAMIEQAAHDRALFAGAGSPVFTKLRFPEAVNAGSPMNHSAGHSNANLDELISHYREKAFAEEEEKRAEQARVYAETAATDKS